MLAKPLFFHHSVILHSMQLKHAKLHTSQGHLTWTRKTNMCQDTKKKTVRHAQRKGDDIIMNVIINVSMQKSTSRV